jgi:P-type Na+/K+ transporter
VVFIASLLFFAGVEVYKFCKRAVLRRRAAKEITECGKRGEVDVEERMFSRYLTGSSGDGKSEKV